MPRDSEYDRNVLKYVPPVPKPAPPRFASKEERDRESGGRSTWTPPKPTEPVITDPNANNPLYELVNGKWVLKKVVDENASSPGKAWKLVGGKWVKDPKPEGNFVWDDDKGWIASTSTGTVHKAKGTIIGTARGSKNGFRVDLIADGEGGYTTSEDIPDDSPEFNTEPVPGSTGFSGTVINNYGDSFAPLERTLAEDTFANTYALIFGKNEAREPYVKELFKLASGFWKSGSDMEESMQLALYEAEEKGAIPQFTKRFKGLFSLKGRNLSGEAIRIPTIAEFIASENAIADTFRSNGMADLATQEFMGDVIGTGKTVNDIQKIINMAFETVDNTPMAIQEQIQREHPYLDRRSLAKALVMGKDGPALIQKMIDKATTRAAAKGAGFSTENDNIGDIANMGLSYAQQQEKFGKAALEGDRGRELSNISGKTLDPFGRDEAMLDEFKNVLSAKKAKSGQINAELARWNASSGTSWLSYGNARSSFGSSDAGAI